MPASLQPLISDKKLAKQARLILILREIFAYYYIQYHNASDLLFVSKVFFICRSFENC